MTFPLAVGASPVLLLCQLLGVIFSLSACTSSPSPLAPCGLQPRWPWRCPTPHLTSDLGQPLQPARVNEQVVPQHVVLHVQRFQPALHLVLNVDASNLHEPKALFVKQLETCGVVGELSWLYMCKLSFSMFEECGWRATVWLLCVVDATLNVQGHVQS